MLLFHKIKKVELKIADDNKIIIIIITVISIMMIIEITDETQIETI